MITIEECVQMSGLTQDEIDAICEHEHIPEVAAAAFADYMMHKEKGPDVLREMVRDDIRDSLARGDKQHAASLMVTLRKMLALHPE